MRKLLSILIIIMVSHIAIQQHIKTQIKIHSRILAEEMCARVTQEKIEEIGHKYAEMLLQFLVFAKDGEKVKGVKEPRYFTDNTKYVEKMMVLETTAYWTHDPIEASGTGIAYDGTEAIPYKTCAIDPKVIPLGSEIYIPTIGWLRANDTGNAINGKILDIAMPSRDAAWNWGRKWVYARVRMPRKNKQ